ncbi:hypothetical protein EON65_47195, partial [archaeon]
MRCSLFLSANLTLLIVRSLRFGILIYYIASLSFRFCFVEKFDPYSNDPSACVFDYLSDAFFFIDFIASLRSQHAKVFPTGVIRGSIVPGTSNIDKVDRSNPTMYETVQKFVNTIANLASICPIELIGYIAGLESYYFLRVTRFLLLKEVLVLWRDICNSLDQMKLVGTNYGIKRVILLIITSAVVGHVGACLFYLISYQAMLTGSKDAWIYYDGLADLTADGGVVFKTTLNFRYLRAIYWSIQTLNTIGFGDIVAKSEAETWFCIGFFYVSA